MKKLLLLLTLAFTITANAQDDKTVILTVSGQGKTQDEARQKALRSAIEQAFGAFISSKTEILNDNLVKDEIVSVTNGNIQKYDVLSETVLPNGGYATTLKAIVSVSKLTSFCESKGVEVEFKGSTFAMNVKLQKLNEEAEYNAILNLCKVSYEILAKSLNFELKVDEPVLSKGEIDTYLIKLNVMVKPNANLKNYSDYFWNTVSKIALNNDEKEDYIKMQKPLFKVLKWYGKKDNTDINPIGEEFFLRNSKSLSAIKILLFKSNNYLLNFRILSEVDTVVVKKCCWELNGPITNNLKKWSFYRQPDFSFPQSRFGSLSNYNCLPTFEAFIRAIEYKSIGELNDLFDPKNNFGLYLPIIGKVQLCSCGTQRALQESKQNEFIIFSNPSLDNYSFYFVNEVKLDKLEKITKYRIEPWVNY